VIALIEIAALLVLGFIAGKLASILTGGGL